MHGTLKLFAPFAAALAIAGCNAGGFSVPASDRPISLGNASDPAVAGAEPRASGLSGSRSRRGAVPAADLKQEPSRQRSRDGVREISRRPTTSPRRAKARDRSSRSSMPTTTPTSPRTSRCTVGTTVCRRQNSTNTIRTGSRATTQKATRAGALRSIWTSRWFRPRVRTARSISSSPTAAACAPMTRQ